MSTHDGKYFIKTVTEDEIQTLIEILPQYHKHLSMRYSILSLFIGLFRLKFQTFGVLFVILMKNISENED